jgi:membrane glycosyltransferase
MTPDCSAPGFTAATDPLAHIAGRAWLPDEAPLAMPVQDLKAEPDKMRHADTAWQESRLWRVTAFGLTALGMTGAGIPCKSVLEVGGFTPLEMLSFGLFEVLFGWLTFSLVITLFGVAGHAAHDAELPELRPGAPMPPLTTRSAILIPVYNEQPEAVFDRLRTMERSLRDLGRHDDFDFFVISDTRQADIIRAEQAAFERLREEVGEHVFYRRRAANEGRKAGNVADWVKRFGGAYEFMVVLDADSLMTGELLSRLAGAIQAHPGVGLIQTAPRLVGRTSLFGRLQQFASRLYGPVMTNGLALFWGCEGNYWGHNAIIRTKAFAEQAGLPVLPGKKPLGGEVMSHDFVEAALLRRAGWQVRVAPRLTGSYEECPPTLPDLIARDRRWCQGNMQHIGLIGTRGLHWMNRFHLIQGAMGYLTSPLWLLFMISSGFLAMENRATDAGEWDMYGVRVLSWVLATTFVCLFLPRVIGLVQVLSNRAERRAWGGGPKLVAGALLEAVFSALIAPIMMISQTKALIDIVLGHDSGWSAQTREDGSVVWREAEKRHRLHILAGLALGLLLYVVSPPTFVWTLPVIAGLIMAAPLTVLTASPGVGWAMIRWGLFATPEEIVNPPRARGPEVKTPIAPTFGPQVELG